MAKGRETSRGGGRAEAVVIIGLVLVLGILLGWFKHNHVFGAYEALKVNLLAGDENPVLPEAVRNAEREWVSARGGNANVVRVDGSRFAVPFSLDRARTVRLKAKVYLQDSDHPDRFVRVLVNGAELRTFEPEWKGTVEELVVNVPASRLAGGVNTVTLAVSEAARGRMAVEFLGIKNYVGISKNFPRAYVVFDGNYGVSGFRALAAASDFLLYPAALFLLWLLSANIAAAAGAGMGTALKKALYAYIPTAAVVVSATVFTSVTPYKLICAFDAFLAFLIAPGAAYGLFHLLRLASSTAAGWGRASRRAVTTTEGAGGKPAAIEVPRPGSALAVLARRLSTAAILFFMACLAAAAVLLVFKKQPLAERMADIAYFSLVFGVVARIFDLRKKDRRKGS